MDLLSDINDNGTTIIMVTHEQNLAKRAHRNILVHDGQVSMSDPKLHIAAQTA